MLRSQPRVPTVRIEDPDVPGGRIINKADYDPAVHTLVDGPGKARGKGKGKGDDEA
jgi:hypothetical protein